MPSTGETTIFVYDAGGALAAEYSTIQNPEPTTSYLTTDHLGSPRVVTDADGEVIARRDFMPFGEELHAGVGGRSTNLKYSLSGTDNIRQRFTGYEKDDETGLDFAEARMYQNRHGRFTVPDPLLASADPINPQTFNRYIYTGNNPVNYTDPSGLKHCRNGDGVVTWRDSCESGETDVDNRVQRCIASPCYTDDGTIGQGEFAWMNGDNGRIERITNPTSEQSAQIAALTDAEVTATAEEVINSGPSFGDHVTSALMTIGENNGGNLLGYALNLRPYDQHTSLGQLIGNTTTVVQGIAEINIGLTTGGGAGLLTIITSPLCGTGIGCIVPAATTTITVTGLLTATHGAGVIGNTIYNMSSNQGPGSRSGRTEPTLPDKTIAKQDGVTVDHKYKSGDHAPAHAHVKGGGPDTKIGANGKPIKGASELTPKQQSVVNQNKSRIRRDVNKIRRWLNYEKYGK